MRESGIGENALGVAVTSKVLVNNLLRVLTVSSLISLALIFSTNAHAQRNNNGTAEIFGTVQGAAGAPVVLHLRALDENPVRYYDGYEEKTAKDGSFHFANIVPGAYRLETGTSDFILPVSKPITLRTGEKRGGVTLSVIPSSSLCGRVTENGIAKKNTWVSAYRYNPRFGTLSLTFFPQTSGDGSFLIRNVLPGTYYLQGYMTYYPGSFSFNGAKPIVVGAGTPTGCTFEIPLQDTGCSTTKVSGSIALAPGDAKERYKVLFLATNPAGGSVAQPMASNANDFYKPGDSFSARVCQGSYDVVLSDDQPIGPWKDSPTHKVVFDTKHIEIGESAIDGVQLTPRAMASISGEVPGMSHNVSCPAGGHRLHVSILREGDGQFQTITLDDKNRFIFSNVAPGDYTISVGPLARDAFYLDSILVDGKPTEGRRFAVADAHPMSMVINISGDLSKAAGHLSPDARQEERWEVGWTRPKGSVLGKVIGASPPGVMLKLRAARYNSNASAEYAVHAGDDGSFRFDAVDPGVYTLRAEGERIVTSEYGALEAGERGTPIVVARGAHIQGFTLSLSKLSSICGRVTTPEGAPQASARIFLLWNGTGGLYGAPGQPEGRTGSDGRFRIDGVSPGEYFLASTLDANHFVFFSPDGTLRAATPETVPVGKDLGCGPNSALSLRVPPNYKQTYSLSGKVDGDLPAAVGDRFWVSLVDVDASGTQSHGVAYSKLDAKRRFSFDKVPAGHFLLQLHSAYGPERMSWSGPYGPVTHLLASQAIDIHEDLTEAVLTPTPLPTVVGTVHFSHLPETWKNNFDVSRQRITLVPREYRAPFSANLSADGSFTIGTEDPGDYEVKIELREPLYVQSVRLDGREVVGRYFHLTAGNTASLEVVVSDDSGQVKARVIPDGSLPIAEPSVREDCRKSAMPQYVVILFPDPRFVRPDAEQARNPTTGVPPRLLRSGTYQDDLAFQIRAVPPGHYRALAVQSLGAMWSPFGGDDRTSIEQRYWNDLVALADPVTVQAGGTVELALPDKTVDAARAAAKRGVSLNPKLFEW
jgi:hypothetical protein